MASHRSFRREDLDVAYLEEVALLLTGEAVLPDNLRDLFLPKSALLEMKGDLEMSYIRIDEHICWLLIEHVNVELNLSKICPIPGGVLALVDLATIRPVLMCTGHWIWVGGSGVRRHLRFNSIFAHPLSRFRESIPSYLKQMEWSVLS